MGRSKKAARRAAHQGPGSDVDHGPDVPLGVPVRVFSPKVQPPTAGTDGAGRRTGGKPDAQDLSVRALYRDNVFVVDQFFRVQECAAWIRYAEGRGFEEARHAASRYVAFRDNGRIEVWDQGVADALWARLSGLVPRVVDGCEACGCHEQIRIYRYAAGGQRFGKHVDQSADGSRDGTHTAITVLVYLNGGDELGQFPMRGGETVFYKDHDGRYEAASFAPTAGSLLYHGHGERCLTHEALAVATGAKYVLRTDVLYSRR